MSLQASQKGGLKAWLKADNYVLHKIHSLTGIVPVGYYVVQHLTLNSFSLAGPKYFDAVVDFFNVYMPGFLLPILSFGVVLLPILFHSLYGFVITYHGRVNVPSYRYRENWMYLLQRVSGVVIFAFLLYHVSTTSFAHKFFGADLDSVRYYGMQAKFQNPLIFAVYAIGITAASFHLSNGIWNFCIRWGITISERAQRRLSKFCWLFFFGLTGLGIAALIGLLIH